MVDSSPAKFTVAEARWAAAVKAVVVFWVVVVSVVAVWVEVGVRVVRVR